MTDDTFQKIADLERRVKALEAREAHFASIGLAIDHLTQALARLRAALVKAGS